MRAAEGKQSWHIKAFLYHKPGATSVVFKDHWQMGPVFKQLLSSVKKH